MAVCHSFWVVDENLSLTPGADDSSVVLVNAAKIMVLFTLFANEFLTTRHFKLNM
jgi:hypothetical protein